MIQQMTSILGLVFMAGCVVQPETLRTVDSRPNVLVIVVDDMGFSDIGSFGGEIETPNLDALAFAGARLTNFQVAPTCSPTRAMLLTGVDNHKAGLGNMLEELSPNQLDQPGYEGRLNKRVVTVASLLRDSGYRTMMSGKWHLGQEPGSRPSDRGFDRAFSLLVGGASHFGDMRPAYAPTPDVKAKYAEDGKLLSALPSDFEYSSQYYVDRLINYLQASPAEEPFFAYLSFTAPHWPLQAPKVSIDKYRGRYAAGYDTLLAKRLEKAKSLGVIPADASENSPPPAYRSWDTLSESERQREARAMEVYAAMIDEVDQHTGRLLAYLKEADEFDNTVIVFLSDNGAEGHDLNETWPTDLFPAIRNTIDTTHDFSYEAMGMPGSYVLYGHGWGRAASPALSLYKAFPTEGGTRAAAFVHYPKAIKSNTIVNDLLSVKDVTPTLLELAGVAHPGSRYAQRAIEPISGVSAWPVLTGLAIESDDERVLAGELFGKRSVRKGDWKIVHMPPPYGNDQWQLYNLREDLAERHDLASTHSNKLAEMQLLWNDYATTNNVILPDWVSGY